jgi:hypothetical protein
MAVVIAEEAGRDNVTFVILSAVTAGDKVLSCTQKPGSADLEIACLAAYSSATSCLHRRHVAVKLGNYRRVHTGPDERG